MTVSTTLYFLMHKKDLEAYKYGGSSIYYDHHVYKLLNLSSFGASKYRRFELSIIFNIDGYN